MTKVKINLASGNVVEKPLVTCFRGTKGDYLVLDNETNGSMGLPIICISKFTGTSAEKIFDQAEWTSVKENLKSIIAGNTVPYLKVPEIITAQDDFFTQLTLPVASFDLLKNVYQVPQTVSPVAPEVAIPAAPVVEQTVMPEPAAQVMPTMEPATSLATAPAFVAPVIPEPVTTPTVDPMAQVMQAAQTPVVETPTVAPMPTMPTFEPTPVIPAAPEITPAPVSIPEPTAPIDSPIAASTVDAMTPELKAIKDNFMQSCETMFDALLKKFQNK